MKKLILGLLSLTFIVSSISAGVFGESVGGSFVGSTLSNVVTQPSRSYRNSGEAARAAIDLASQANSVAIRADEKINRLEYEVNKIRPMEIRINALEDRDRRLEEENRRLEQEVRSIRELIYKFRAETATFTEEEKKKMASQFTDGEQKEDTKSVQIKDTKVIEIVKDKYEPVKAIEIEEVNVTAIPAG